MKKGTPERNEGVLLSTARRVNGICNPLTPTLIKARSKMVLFSFLDVLSSLK